MVARRAAVYWLVGRIFDRKMYNRSEIYLTPLANMGASPFSVIQQKIKLTIASIIIIWRPSTGKITKSNVSITNSLGYTVIKVVKLNSPMIMETSGTSVNQVILFFQIDA